MGRLGAGLAGYTYGAGNTTGYAYDANGDVTGITYPVVKHSYLVMDVHELPRTIIAINVGGALIPTVLSIYLMMKNLFYQNIKN